MTIFSFFNPLPPLQKINTSIGALCTFHGQGGILFFLSCSGLFSWKILVESELYYSTKNIFWKEFIFCFWHDFKICILFNRIGFVWEKIINSNRNIFCSQKIVILTYNQGLVFGNFVVLKKKKNFLEEIIFVDKISMYFNSLSGDWKYINLGKLFFLGKIDFCWT